MPTTFIENTNKPREVVKVKEAIEKDTESVDDRDIDDYIGTFLDISNDAKKNDKEEKSMSLLEGLKTFPKAAAWSIVLSSSIIMEGYDTTLIASFFGFPAFKEKYGKYSNGSYEIPTRWQTGLQVSINVGEIIGLFMAGIIADRIGYRYTLIGSLVLVIGFIFIPFFAKDIEMLLAGEILLGVPWGAFQTLSISYSSEVCPLVLRPYLTTYVNICWSIGQLIASGVLRGFVSNETSLSYRVPFAIQWVWPIPIIVGIFLAPESPWWLAKKDKIQQAEVSIGRLISENKNVPSRGVLSKAILHKIQMTINEELGKTENPSYWECFKGVDFRRTRVACIVWIIQNICGTSLMGYASYFFIQAGMSTDMSFTFTIIMYVIGILGTLLSWTITSHCGRSKIYFYGLCFMAVLLLIIGGLGCSSQKDVSWAIGALLIVFAFTYNSSLGPLVYCIVTELPSVRLRTKTIIIARNLYNIAGIVVQVITPYMLNPTAWNWKAKSGFLWAGFCIIGAVWSFFELPETKGRTFAELDILFKNNTPTRRFKTTEVDVFDSGKFMERIGEDGIRDFVKKNERSELV
ncbi:uncharacterized protein PRCAT00002310001 [Priceomyces carsonii]|uniref:uncharacterized protein n=1 Tax=Priceomyces carsonii TaxID=28549 RepID=UPI002EDAC778|nr:unnamed protein product [Priceomyces carsonii]